MSNYLQSQENTFIDSGAEDEQFLRRDTGLGSPRNDSTMSSTLRRQRKAKLAREETLDYDYDPSAALSAKLAHQQRTGASGGGGGQKSAGWLCNLLKRKTIFIPLLLVSCVAAIYCVPYIEIEPKVLRRLPNIPFNFNDGPLRPSGASQFKIARLFQDQVRGPESIALDAAGNMYMAIEGGFVLYAHLNRSSPLKRSYYEAQAPNSPFVGDASPSALSLDELLERPVKIAELNGIKQVPYDRQPRRRAREGYETSSGAWRRECQLDEHIYGQNLYSGGSQSAKNQDDARDPETEKFRPLVHLSRCSKPLGVRLSPDESYLYIVDTLSGLYRVSLKVPERPYTTQRLVTKLVDFKPNRIQLLPIVRSDAPNFELPATTTTPPPTTPSTEVQSSPTKTRAFMNVSLKAVDDLVIDHGAGTRGGDIIYMTLASQNWMALSYLYDLLEGRPSGLVLRYDSGVNQLGVLDPERISQVRTSNEELENPQSRLYTTTNVSSDDPYLGIGAPRLDENDVFDERPLHFPNGLELTDDRQAILIADTSNHRIIKHYIRGPRKGTSDLWAWTPNSPDNIRRSHDKNQETYWVAGCGQDMTNKVDPQALLNSWPRVRKFMLKNLYLFGWLIEVLGKYVLHSTRVQDFGYSFKTGSSLCEQACPGMMIIQYNKYGDIMRSIHSRDFPNDLAYVTQADEIFDPISQEHILYVSSVSYQYVTKLVLPTDSHPIDAPAPSSTASYAFYDDR